MKPTLKAERGQPCPRVRSERTIRADKAVRAPDANGELKETEIGMVAKDWNVITLEVVCEPPQYGFTASAEETGNVRFLRITDITDSGVNWPTVPFCECPPELLDKYRLVSGDIVFARIGATTGKSCVITHPPASVFASYLIRVRPKQQLDSTFLGQFFKSASYWRQVDSQKNANLKKGVSGSLLKTLLVPVPPVAEQRKIAGVLGLVQRAMEQQERLLELAAELKKALLHQLFTHGLRHEPQKQTELGPIPQSWDVVKLGDLFGIKHGFAFDGAFFKETGEYILLTPGHFHEEGGFRDQGTKTKYFTGTIPHSYLLSEGDLLVAMTEQKAGLLGSSAIIPVSEKFLHNQRLGLVVDLKASRLDKMFLFYLFNTTRVRVEIAKTSSGSKVRHTSPGKIREIKTALAELPEQKEIATILRTVDAKVDLVTRKHAALSALFRTLLHELMTAQIRVHNLELGQLLE